MLNILVAAPAKDGLKDFCAALAEGASVALDWAQSGQEALRKAAENAPHMVLIDQDLGDMAPFDLVAKLLGVNALINTVVVSDLPDEEFHEASEGLGIMACLPPRPGREQAPAVLEKLKSLTGL
ncbi:hypothetical protein AAU61_13430 [Desulfocarbo indianensis]|nr:hypothetical protein AAU61_13430 [Desulfocarbo indianensis]